MDEKIIKLKNELEDNLSKITDLVDLDKLRVAYLMRKCALSMMVDVILLLEVILLE